MDITFDDIMQAVQKLSPQQKLLLAQSLEIPPLDIGPTREALIAELDALCITGAFEQVQSLRNKYANPALNQLTDEQLSADIHAAATEWEQELDEFFGTED